MPDAGRGRELGTVRTEALSVNRLALDQLGVLAVVKLDGLATSQWTEPDHRSTESHDTERPPINAHHVTRRTFTQLTRLGIGQGYVLTADGFTFNRIRLTHGIPVAPIPARREAMRGTFDPGYLNYTLGKLMILKLRSDYRREKGAAYSLKEFHDKLLSYGAPPLPLLRQVMLSEPGDSAI